MGKGQVIVKGDQGLGFWEVISVLKDQQGLK